MRSRASPKSACCLAAVALIATATFGDGRRSPRGNLPESEAFAIRTCRGITTFQVELPDSVRSDAWSADCGPVDKAGDPLAPAAAYRLTSRVVVRSDDPGPLAGLSDDRPDITIERLDAAPGFWIVTAASVRDAIHTADLLAPDERVAEVYLDIDRPKVLRETPTDPFFYLQWHLENNELPVADVNAEPAWDAGYTGSGVVIGIIEGGWQYSHPDLVGNYNHVGTQPGGNSTAHATACAGVAAAVANNDLGGASIAYGAQVSGQLYGTDAQNAAAFEYRNDINDIKSNSWGPSDNGTIAYMSSVERAAIENSIATGRGGLGEVFTWAGGNGRLYGDRVDYDPYASSRFTIAIGAIGDLDYQASYSEPGSSLLAVAHSSGNNRKIYTTTNNSGYTTSFGGTSAASPLAAGVIAMMLEANPELTWRDVQHVLVNSARICDPNHPGWTTNAAGHDVNHAYGFGAVDAFEAVSLAGSWVNVGPETMVDSGVILVNALIPNNDPVGLTEAIEIDDDIRIESVELILNIDTTYAGDLQIVLTGPEGTESVLATQRGDSSDGYVDFIFTSLRHWDETSAGTWTVDISDHAAGDQATWIDYRLKIYGTQMNPCPADLSGDGVVNESDLGILLAAFGVGPGGDIDGDGDTDFQDLMFLLMDFGQECG
jgi:subtilisin-like proprotein convertase family protein